MGWLGVIAIVCIAAYMFMNRRLNADELEELLDCARRDWHIDDLVHSYVQRNRPLRGWLLFKAKRKIATAEHEQQRSAERTKREQRDAAVLAKIKRRYDRT